MATTSTAELGRISRREFVQRAARRAQMSPAQMQTAYEAMIGELTDLVADGNRVTLTGFGRFFPQLHKGHLTRQGNELKPIPDYTIFRFQATKEVNKELHARIAGRTREVPLFEPKPGGFVERTADDADADDME